MLGADVPLRLVLVEVVSLPDDVVAGSGEVGQAVAEQVIVVGLEVDLAAVLEEIAVLDELTGVGEDTVSRIYINFCNPWSKKRSCSTGCRS